MNSWSIPSASPFYRVESLKNSDGISSAVKCQIFLSAKAADCRILLLSRQFQSEFWLYNSQHSKKLSKFEFSRPELKMRLLFCKEENWIPHCKTLAQLTPRTQKLRRVIHKNVTMAGKKIKKFTIYCCTYVENYKWAFLP